MKRAEGVVGGRHELGGDRGGEIGDVVGCEEGRRRGANAEVVEKGDSDDGFERGDWLRGGIHWEREWRFLRKGRLVNIRKEGGSDDERVRKANSLKTT